MSQDNWELTPSSAEGGHQFGHDLARDLQLANCGAREFEGLLQRLQQLEQQQPPPLQALPPAFLEPLLQAAREHPDACSAGIPQQLAEQAGRPVLQPLPEVVRRLEEELVPRLQQLAGEHRVVSWPLAEILARLQAAGQSSWSALALTCWTLAGPCVSLQIPESFCALGRFPLKALAQIAKAKPDTKVDMSGGHTGDFPVSPVHIAAAAMGSNPSSTTRPGSRGPTPSPVRRRCG